MDWHPAQLAGGIPRNLPEASRSCSIATKLCPVDSRNQAIQESLK
ncbi:hypothetical protein [Coleofasciculus sp. FACHB-64]|nr:hypothetical protein [Coleofasciculus sp. FACHB-64]